jgi:SagB-type dehydrogenase family enzyme
MNSDLIEQQRNFLKDYIRLEFDFNTTDQNKGIQAPPIQKPYPPNNKLIKLPSIDYCSSIKTIDLKKAIENRKSVRTFSKVPINLNELSFLLWATQGIKEKRNSASTLRVVPSAGCRHSFETYLCILNVDELVPGIYRYLPIEHSLLLEHESDNLSTQLNTAVLNQTFASLASVIFVWATIPYRMEWRYGLAAHRVILMDVGHVCQNLYLACEAIGAGTCAIAAYDQDKMDLLLNLDGKEEFTIYLAPVGKNVNK